MIKKNGRLVPDMILKAMKVLKVSNRIKVVKIGDSEIDVEEEKLVNCGYTIADTTRAKNKQQFNSRFYALPNECRKLENNNVNALLLIGSLDGRTYFRDVLK